MEGPETMVGCAIPSVFSGGRARSEHCLHSPNSKHNPPHDMQARFACDDVQLRHCSILFHYITIASKSRFSNRCRTSKPSVGVPTPQHHVLTVLASLAHVRACICAGTLLLGRCTDMPEVSRWCPRTCGAHRPCSEVTKVLKAVRAPAFLLAPACAHLRTCRRAYACETCDLYLYVMLSCAMRRGTCPLTPWRSEAVHDARPPLRLRVACAPGARSSCVACAPACARCAHVVRGAVCKCSACSCVRALVSSFSDQNRQNRLVSLALIQRFSAQRHGLLRLTVSQRAAEVDTQMCTLRLPFSV